MRYALTRNQPDYLFIAFVFILVIFGLVMLTSASSDLGKTKFGDSYYYLKHQIYYGLLSGIAGFFIGFWLYHGHWAKFATILLVINIFFLLAVFSPLGVRIKGGDRWLNLGILTFQPGELIKLTFFIYLASWISKAQARSKKFFEGFLPFFTLVGGVMLLLLLEPATSTAMLIFGASLLIYFTAGARFRFIVAAFLLIAVGVSILIYVTPYRLERVLTFLDRDADPLGRSYQINQALDAIGAGGISGVGFGQSTTKLRYLPEPIGDSIFAVIAEELGFVGAIFVVIIFLLFVWRGLRIAKRSRDSFGRLLTTGFTCLIGLQAFVNMAAVSGVIPLSGVPLPFISYGGTALAVFLTMSGIIANISKYRR